ncbi:MAG TPA: hypothetical protein VIC51_11950 [Psychromonas sp.]
MTLFAYFFSAFRKSKVAVRAKDQQIRLTQTPEAKAYDKAIQLQQHSHAERAEQQAKKSPRVS